MQKQLAAHEKIGLAPENSIVVSLTGVEPVSRASEALILSVGPQGHFLRFTSDQINIRQFAFASSPYLFDLEACGSCQTL